MFFITQAWNKSENKAGATAGDDESDIENEQQGENDEEEDPLYDRVPSDEDYASVASEPSCSAPFTNLTENNHHKNQNSAACLLMSKSKSPPKNAGSYFSKITSPLKVNTSATATATSPLHSAVFHSQKSSKNNTHNQNSPASVTSMTRSLNKNTPSPRFASKEHKILTTNFDKPPLNITPGMGNGNDSKF